MRAPLASALYSDAPYFSGFGLNLRLFMREIKTAQVGTAPGAGPCAGPCRANKPTCTAAACTTRADSSGGFQAADCGGDADLPGRDHRTVD